MRTWTVKVKSRIFSTFFLFVYLFFFVFFQVAAHHSQPAAGTAARATGSRAGSKGQEGMLYGNSGPGCGGHAVKSVDLCS